MILVMGKKNTERLAKEILRDERFRAELIDEILASRNRTVELASAVLVAKHFDEKPAEEAAENGDD